MEKGWDNFDTKSSHCKEYTEKKWDGVKRIEWKKKKKKKKKKNEVLEIEFNYSNINEYDKCN